MSFQSYIKNTWVQLKNSVKDTYNKYAPTWSYQQYKPNAIIVNKIDVRPVVRQTQDINKWRSALMVAEGIGQQRQLIYDLYSEIMLDGFLKAVIRKRRLSITNARLTFTKNGKAVDDVVALTKKSYFADLLKHIIDARIYGHSLIEIVWSKDSGETILIDRRHVKPRYRIVTQNMWDTEGYRFDEDPFKSKVMEVGDAEDLGELLECCPYVIYKRGDFGDWAEFAEVFGMPTIFAKYQNPETRQALEDALDQMGSRGRMVAPNDAEMEYHEASQGTGAGEVFNKLREALNEEIAITVLGNTMTTTEAKHSGYAQSKTHADSQDELKEDDRMFVIRNLNEKLNPLLAQMGFDTEGGEWSFVEQDNMSLTDRLALDIQLNNLIDIDEDYFYETYKVPRPKGEIVGGEDEPEEDMPTTKSKKKEPTNTKGN
jgi:hypothetical protein